MTQLKTATKEFLKAGKALVSAIVNHGKDAVTPIVNDVQSKITHEQVKQELKKKKVVDIKQDKSRRKYHRGG